MDRDLSFLANLVINGSKQLQIAAAREHSGRGHSLIDFIDQSCTRVAHEATVILGQLPLKNHAFGPPLERELSRLRYEMDLIHKLVADYHGDTGRQDLPVGLLLLIDELIRDLLPKGADPIIHLDTYNMYSTTAVIEVVKGLLRRTTPRHPHPVAFNLPAVDPANVLLSPILTHEVGHTAWRQGLRAELNKKADLKSAGERLKQGASSSGTDAAEVARIFDSWRQELLCDALAAALTGPSFLFASTVFLPAPSALPMGSHPYPRDRLAYTFRILTELGWDSFLLRHVPNVFGWCQEIATNVALTGHPVETALREAIGIIEPAITRTALSTTSGNRADPGAMSRDEEQLFGLLELEVPPIVIEQRGLGPWVILAAAWVYEVARRGDTPEAVANTSSDIHLNQFLVKSIELATIKRLWTE